MGLQSARRLIAAMLLASAPAVTAWSWNLAERPLPYAAPAATLHSQGKDIALTEYHGRKIMLWLFSTWCHTCVAGAQALGKINPDLRRHGVVVLAVRNHNNGGTPGPSIEEFFVRLGDSSVKADNWVLGEASAEMDRRYNARQFPDIYFLIDEQGQVRVVSTAPAATLNTIEQFASNPSHATHP